MYILCYEQSVWYRAELSHVIGFNENSLNDCDFTHVIWTGDFNVNLLEANDGAVQVNYLMHKYALCCLTEYELKPVKHSYVNSALNQASMVDHFWGLC